MKENQSLKPYDKFRSQVYDMVRKIPKGRVMTYGRIAAKISKPPGIDPLAYKRIRARWVGYAMKSCPQDVPWWRVVNRRGKISLRSGHGPHIQPLLLKEEGIVMDEEGKITLKDYLWTSA